MILIYFSYAAGKYTMTIVYLRSNKTKTNSESKSPVEGCLMLFSPWPFTPDLLPLLVTCLTCCTWEPDFRGSGEGCARNPNHQVRTSFRYRDMLDTIARRLQFSYENEDFFFIISLCERFFFSIFLFFFQYILNWLTSVRSILLSTLFQLLMYFER